MPVMYCRLLLLSAFPACTTHGAGTAFMLHFPASSCCCRCMRVLVLELHRQLLWLLRPPSCFRHCCVSLSFMATKC